MDAVEHLPLTMLQKNGTYSPIFSLLYSMEYFRLFIRMSTMLNPDFPFEYISCDPYIKTVVVSKKEIEDYKDIVKVEKADRLEWHRYQQTTYW